MLRLEKDVLAADVEAIHDYRVAVRRIRFAFKLITDAAKDDKAVKLRKKGRDFGRLTGAVRDLDVLHAQAKSGKAPQAWTLLLAVERGRAIKNMTNLLQSKRYGRWKEKLNSWLDEDPQDLPLHDRLSQTIQEYAKAVCDHEKAKGDEELHALRIAIKWLRYLLEFFEDEISPASQAAIGRLAVLQDVLGEYHDLAVAIAKLEETISAARGLKPAGPLRKYKSLLAERQRQLAPDRAAAEAIEVAKRLI